MITDFLDHSLSFYYKASAAQPQVLFRLWALPPAAPACALRKKKKRKGGKIFLTIDRRSANILLAHGGIAQLGERLNGIQEVSGSIPLISTIACFMACILRSTSLFISPKNKYRDDAGNFHRRSSILPPTEKGRFHVPLIVKAAFFYCHTCISPLPIPAANRAL